MLQGWYKDHTDVSQTQSKISRSIIDRDIDSYRLRLSGVLNNMRSLHHVGSAPVDPEHMIP